MTTMPSVRIRICDFCVSAAGLLLLSPFLVLCFIIGYIDTRSPLFAQTRVGQHGRLFTLYKFRSMRPSAPEQATHLSSQIDVTSWGRIMRKTKIDELPQLVNVLKGQMSLVGPRPCLPAQTELISERTRLGVDNLKPGITGPAQIAGIDMSEPRKLAEIDAQLIPQSSLYNYIVLVVFTLIGKGSGDKIGKN